ncbi:Mitochondrial inner membrane protease atp23 [Malassezia vespertilionis]|uniref:Mitochondrial inner membrane protease ATP23 n=1 Tax=Malassezia vespertilionis TaxID=2020962 RepID=A0A2N1J8A2_9BASI|nr:Mitochondrial inner membrane protease atp23 [Malassezia vespertilionis]PKI82797.1 Atp23p [Malassezia vespertilionis]WFD08169.1 Mitochondrial inner membrane protease atp23 [Malassezia vespertilionis]
MSVRHGMPMDADTSRLAAWSARVMGASSCGACPYPVHSIVDNGKACVGADAREDIVAQQRCEQWKNDLLRTSPMVRFMVKHLTIIGCDPVRPRPASALLPPKLLIAACPPDIAGGFSPAPANKDPSEAGILLCANRIYSKAHLEDTLAHEMIHWWDSCRFKVDWNDLRHHACSEVRAASLSGDCRWTREINRRHFTFLNQHQECARRRAILSVRANPKCADEETAARVVDEVWDSCFNDTRPFDEIY